MCSRVALALGLLALAAPAWAAALTAEQADALAGVWVLESSERLYGYAYDEKLAEAAGKDAALDPKALLDAALDARPGPPIKLVIGAVDPRTGLFVGYRVPSKPDPFIPDLLRIVGIAFADAAGTVKWTGVENDEAGGDTGVVQGDTMAFLHLDPHDVYDDDELVNPSGMFVRVLKKDKGADMEAELRNIAELLPLAPTADPADGGGV